MREIKAVETDTNEEWRKIPGAPDRYEVSNLGRVRSLYGRIYSNGSRSSGRILKPGIKPGGYNFLSLGRSYSNKHVHRLVASAFIPNPNNLPEVNHKDGNKLNNAVTNLEWVTRSENGRHFHRSIGSALINPVVDLETGVYYANAIECFELNRDKIGHPYGTFKEWLGGRKKNKTPFVRCGS